MYAPRSESFLEYFSKQAGLIKTTIAKPSRVQWYGDDEIWEGEGMVMETFFEKENEWLSCFLKKTIFESVDEGRYKSKMIYPSHKKAIEGSVGGTFFTRGPIRTKGCFANRANLVIWLWHL